MTAINRPFWDEHGFSRAEPGDKIAGATRTMECTWIALYQGMASAVPN